MDQTGFPEITRTFAYTIIRENGRIGDVMLNVLTTYTPVSNTESLRLKASLSVFQDPTAEYVEEFSTVFEDGRNQLRVELPVSPDAYIAPGSVFTISITDAALQDLEGLLCMRLCVVCYVLGFFLQHKKDLDQKYQVQQSLWLLIVWQMLRLALIPTHWQLPSTKVRTYTLYKSTLYSLPFAESTESNNVVLTVVRRGELGTVMVYWTAGLPGSSIANGSLTPEQGSFQMIPTDTSYQILLTVSLPMLTVMCLSFLLCIKQNHLAMQATPRSPHGVPEVFAVSLTVEPLVPLSLPAEVSPTAGTALLEPSGVVQLASNAFSGVESTGNVSELFIHSYFIIHTFLYFIILHHTFITSHTYTATATSHVQCQFLNTQILVNVQRYYGSMGDIQVFGVASVAPNTTVPSDQVAAVESIDFAATLVQVTIPDGSTSGVLSVPVFDNLESGPLKILRFTLTSVTGGMCGAALCIH